MLPDKVMEMENSIGYHTSINQSEESISIRCIIITIYDLAWGLYSIWAIVYD